MAAREEGGGRGDGGVGAGDGLVEGTEKRLNGEGEGVGVGVGVEATVDVGTSTGGEGTEMSIGIGVSEDTAGREGAGEGEGAVVEEIGRCDASSEGTDGGIGKAAVPGVCTESIELLTAEGADRVEEKTEGGCSSACAADTERDRSSRDEMGGEIGACGNACVSQTDIA